MGAFTKVDATHTCTQTPSHTHNIAYLLTCRMTLVICYVAEYLWPMWWVCGSSGHHREKRPRRRAIRIHETHTELLEEDDDLFEAAPLSNGMVASCLRTAILLPPPGGLACYQTSIVTVACENHERLLLQGSLVWLPDHSLKWWNCNCRTLFSLHTDIVTSLWSSWCSLAMLSWALLFLKTLMHITGLLPLSSRLPISQKLW